MSRLFENFGDDAGELEFAAQTNEQEALFEGDAPPAQPQPDGHAGDTERLAASDAEDAADESDDQADRVSMLLPDEYTIPDFERDGKDLSAYEDAKKRHIRQQIASGETAITASFKTKRDQLQMELKNARSFEDERRSSAIHTTRQYANSYPGHVDKKGVNPPSFFENLFSFGRAGRLYRAALMATEALEQLRAAMRKCEEQLGTLESQMNRALYLKEESVKKTMETEAGINEFNNRPEIRDLHKRTTAIQKERNEFARRLKRGGVSDEEQRDRAMGEFRYGRAELPLMGTIIVKVARFGRLTYFILRDLKRKEFALSYDPRLDPLRNSVFDVYAVAGAVAAKVKRNDNGTAFRVSDHFKVCWRNQDEAEELWKQHRAALQDERGLPKMEPRDENEAEILERLASLAIMVQGGAQPDAPAPSTAIGAAPRF